MGLFSLFANLVQGQEIPVVKMETNKGVVVLELDPTRAPETVKNFLTYVEEDFYTGTLFHRVIKDFMIQGGGYTKDYKQKSTHPSVKNESANGLKNLRGTVAMARTGDPHSATSQFFINVVDNTFLDYRSPTAQGWGYTVFGKVVEGLDVVDKIRQSTTGSTGGLKDVPQEPIIIEKMTVTYRDAAKTVAPTPVPPTDETTEERNPVPKAAEPAPLKEEKKEIPPAVSKGKESPKDKDQRISPPDSPTEPDVQEPPPR